MSRSLRRPWRIVAAVVALAIGTLVAANAVDEELRPEARALFRPPPLAFAPNSGWALLAGIHAPVGQEPRRYAESSRKAAATRKAGAQVPRTQDEIEVRAPDELLCMPEASDCTRAFAQRPESIADLAADNAVLMARYDELVASRQLADVTGPLDYFGAIPFFNLAMRAQLVRISQIGAFVSTGRVEPALAWLDADAAFFRRWLEEAGSILTKMLALRGLSRDLLVAGQVARSGGELTAAQWDTLERIAAPPTPAQRGMGPVIRTEAVIYAGLMDRMLAEPRATSAILDSPRLVGTILSVTMRPGATLNFSHPLFAAWMQLDAVPSDQLAAAIARVEEGARRHTAPDWTWAYNFTGKSVAADASPPLTEYFYRLRDLDALAAVVRCTVALRRAAVAVDAADDFVASSPACRDPYEGRQLAWDRERGELSFRPRSPAQVKRFGGSGDRVAFAAYPR